MLQSVKCESKSEKVKKCSVCGLITMPPMVGELHELTVSGAVATELRNMLACSVASRNVGDHATPERCCIFRGPTRFLPFYDDMW